MNETTTTTIRGAWNDARAAFSLNAYQLANRADCGTPDSLTSEGARLLLSVQDGAIELVDYLDDDDLRRLAEDPVDIQWLDDSGAVHEVADGAPSVYTATLWAEFVDLAAYSEDLDDLGGPTTYMNQNAGVCLYMIASRLAWAVLGELAEALAEAVAEVEDAEDEG